MILPGRRLLGEELQHVFGEWEELDLVSWTGDVSVEGRPGKVDELSHQGTHPMIWYMRTAASDKRPLTDSDDTVAMERIG